MKEFVNNDKKKLVGSIVSGKVMEIRPTAEHPFGGYEIRFQFQYKLRGGIVKQIDLRSWAYQAQPGKTSVKLEMFRNLRKGNTLMVGFYPITTVDNDGTPCCFPNANYFWTAEGRPMKPENNPVFGNGDLVFGTF